jgi:hypothetical protein
MEVNPTAFLTSAINGDERSSSRSGRLTGSARFTGNCVTPKEFWRGAEEKNIFPSWESKLFPLAYRQPF